MRHLISVLQFVMTIGILVLSDIPMVQATSSRVKLIEHITSNYHSSIRPVFDTDTVTNVTLRVLFHHLIDMDTRRQLFTISIWVKETWRDEFISWNTSDFGGIQSIYVPSHIIWKPDITLYTNVDPEFTRFKPDPLSLVWYDGRVEWLSPGILSSYCKISVRHFPFDTQVCEMNYASWSYTDLQVKLLPEVGRLAAQDRYVENGVWDLRSVTVKDRSFWYSCCPNNFSEVVYTLTFRRHPEFYVIHLVLPCVFLSVLALLVFYLPPDCGEKLTLAITNLLALVVFQQVIAEHLPPSGDAPIIETYFLVMIIMVCMSVGCTVLVIHMAGKTHPVSPFTLKLVEYLERALWVNSTRQQEKDFNGFSSCPTYDMPEDETSISGHSRKYSDQLQQYQSKQTNAINNIEKIVNNHDNVLQVNSSSGDFLAEWKRLALVLDRVLLVTFLIFALITTLTFAIQLYAETKECMEGTADKDAIELITSD
ncbi:neuronal acetylcholine receptor subunit alpha-10-like [Amphiura filiformis]|uniref:neuronal acetylcholine receptor subunit alpha-10-like n=1 Tax=Amphiura filiformis TaxID=82378 RepID=UPI003B20D2C2